MTERQKMLADREMLYLWKQFVYEETMKGEPRDYRHLDKVIREGAFSKKYLQCGNKYSVWWIFISAMGNLGILMDINTARKSLYQLQRY